jgi:hypothetical protein
MLRQNRDLASLLVCFVLAGSLSVGQEHHCAKGVTYGKCFGVHGRFRVYTADGIDELGPIGSHRLYRVEDGADALEKALGDGDMERLAEIASEYQLLGDFVVCPIEEEVRGKMRAVCVDSVGNLKRVPRE